MVGKRKESFHESNQCPPKRLLSYITDPAKGNVDCEQQNVLYEDFHKRANEVNLLITNNNETIKSKTTLLQHFEAKLQNAKCFEKLFEQLLKFAGGDSIKTVKATAEIVEACADFVATEDSELEYLRQLERIRGKNEFKPIWHLFLHGTALEAC